MRGEQGLQQGGRKPRTPEALHFPQGPWGCDDIVPSPLEYVLRHSIRDLVDVIEVTSQWAFKGRAFSLSGSRRCSVRTPTCGRGSLGTQSAPFSALKCQGSWAKSKEAIRIENGP